MLETLILQASLDENPYFFGYMGIASALVLANLGAAYGTAKSGVGICTMGILKPDLIIRSVIPVIMAGILGIYGLIVAVILQGKISSPSGNNGYTYKMSFSHLCSGLCCGVSALGAGIAIGIGGDAGVRALGQQDRIFVGMMLILIFDVVLGFYVLIVSLILVA